MTVTAGQAIQARIQLSSYQAPQVDSIDPTSATVGQNITINGTNFGAAQGDSLITFNGVQGVPTFWSDTQIICPVPVGATSGDVVVTVNESHSNNTFLIISPGWERNFGGTSNEYCRGILQENDGGFVIVSTTESSASGDIIEFNHGSTDIWVFKIDAFGNIIWQNIIGGNASDNAQAMVKVPGGGYLLGGFTWSSENGDMTGVNHGGNGDFWIVKLSSDGEILWDKNYGGIGGDQLRSMCITIDNNYLLVGYTDTSEDGDISGASNGGLDYWVVKIDPNGEIIWEKNFGGSGNDLATSVKPTSDGGCIIVGYTISSESGDVSGVNHGANDYWIVKLDYSGDIQWQKLLGGNGNDTPMGIEITQDGGYIISGTTSSSANGDISGVNHGGRDGWIVKLNSSGSIVWERNYGGNNDDSSVSVIRKSGTHFLIAGSTGSSTNGDVTGVNNGMQDTWLYEIDDTGNILWSRNYGGANNDATGLLAITIDGKIAVAGVTQSSQSGDIYGVNNGNNDIWLLFLDSDGELR